MTCWALMRTASPHLQQIKDFKMIIFAETTADDKHSLLEMLDKEIHPKISFLEQSANEENGELFKDASILLTFIHSKIDANLLAKLPHLTAIITRSTGYDHIDLEACRKRNIIVANIPSYGQNTVAEYTFTLILALARNLKPMIERIEKGVFTRQGLQGFDLFGKTIGVIGTGKIGSHVVSIARGFGMNILCHAHYQEPDIISLGSVQYVPLNDLLQQSDIVTLHVPSNSSTFHLINKENIPLMKPSAMLINTARGPVIDIEAIVEQLHQKNLKGGVGLDTFESEEIWIEEKYLKNNTLSAIELHKALMAFSILHSPNVILSPHNAYNTAEALERILQLSVDNLHHYIQTGEMITPVA